MVRLDFEKRDETGVSQKPGRLLHAGGGEQRRKWNLEIYRQSEKFERAHATHFISTRKTAKPMASFVPAILRRINRSGGADRFTYDPLDTRRGERSRRAPSLTTKLAGVDQRFPMSIGNDGLVYHTDPLPKEMPLVGCPQLTLWLSIDTPDTDLSADLYEIQPDGTSIALWSDLRRLRYRESLYHEKLIKGEEIVTMRFCARIVCRAEINERQPAAPRRLVAQFDFLAEKL